MAEPTTRELLRRVEAASAEIAAMEAEHRIEAEVERRLAAERAARQALPRRSKMSAKEISNYLTAHGRKAFEALPR